MEETTLNKFSLLCVTKIISTNDFRPLAKEYVDYHLKITGTGEIKVTLIEAKECGQPLGVKVATTVVRFQDKDYPLFQVTTGLHGYGIVFVIQISDSERWRLYTDIPAPRKQGQITKKKLRELAKEHVKEADKERVYSSRRHW